MTKGPSPPGPSRWWLSTFRAAAVALVAEVAGGTVVALTDDRTPAAPAGAAAIAPEAGGHLHPVRFGTAASLQLGAPVLAIASGAVGGAAVLAP